MVAVVSMKWVARILIFAAGFVLWSVFLFILNDQANLEEPFVIGIAAIAGLVQTAGIAAVIRS